MPQPCRRPSSAKSAGRGFATAALLLALALPLALPGQAQATTVTIVNRDSAGIGLNDHATVSPVGGNIGTTKGAQALIVFQRAAQLWGTKLVSNVEIKVDSNFAPLSCTTGSGTLGSAGPASFWLNFTNAPRADTIYPQALANALFGADVDPAKSDIAMQFNGAIGGPTCLAGLSWYMGLDTNAPAGTVSLLSVTLHEMAHGLGFLSLVSPSTGAKASGFDDAFMLKLESHALAQQFPAITDSQRLSAITSLTGLHWTGPAVLSANGSLSAGVSSGHVLMYAPSPVIAGSSVSHFDTSLTPNELMEQSYTSANLDLTRTVLALKDVGWNVCGNGTIENGEQCDDGNTSSSDCCTSACNFAPSTVVCRASTGTCDPQELCTGSSAACPANMLSAEGSVCRAAAGICDAVETCNGSSAACPADTFLTGAQICRASSGACDPAENCTGANTACPGNLLAAAGSACTSDGQVCTTDECDGASAACRYHANFNTCDDGAFCDGSDSCSGGSCSIHAGNPCSGTDGDANCAESCDESANTCTAADPNSNPCNDGDDCTDNDQCSAGACAGQPISEGTCGTTTTTLPAERCGDANEDGNITSSDALRALKAAVGTTACSLTRCDYNGDGHLSASDALAILRVAVGQVVPTKCPHSTVVSPALSSTTTVTTTSTTLDAGD